MIHDLVGVVPKATSGKPASALHGAMLRLLRELFAEHGLTIKAGMKRGGGSEQLYNLWQRGASPTLKKLEQIAAAYDRGVTLTVGERQAFQISPESAEIAAAIDELPDDARAEIAKSVSRQAGAYRSGIVKIVKKSSS